MKILSLFDGMACGHIALTELGYDTESYKAYEIDKYAIKVATHNFPDIEECGDVFTGDFREYEGYDWFEQTNYKVVDDMFSKVIKDYFFDTWEKGKRPTDYELEA